MAKGGYRGGYGGMGGMNQMQMMKQAQKMQQDLLKMQEELEQAQYTASAGGGVVSATVSGKRELTALEIQPDAVDPEDVEMLQDMVIAAVNEALRKAEDASAQSMSRITGGLNLGF
ncbi:MAG: YbaB/EbfC family nucleoid-associated protein [Oscillospiraceae bacterium]